MKRLVMNIFTKDDDTIDFNLMEVAGSHKKFLVINVRSSIHLDVKDFEKGRMEATNRRYIEISSTEDLKKRIVQAIVQIHPMVFAENVQTMTTRRPSDFLYEVQIIANDEVQLEYNIPANLNAEGIYNHIQL